MQNFIKIFLFACVAAWIFVSTLISGAIMVGVVVWTLKRPAPDTLRTVDLYSLGTVLLPSSFELQGLMDVSMNSFTHHTPENFLKYHMDSREAVFKFSKDNTSDWGGYSTEPILLNIWLFNPAISEAERLHVRDFSIRRYYSPSSADNIPLDSLRWKTETKNGLLWRWLEMADHFQDRKKRWAIILIDPKKGTRLDFFAWESKYSLDDAKTLLSKINDSIRLAPGLASHFRRASTSESRIKGEAQERVLQLEQDIKACDLAAPIPGRTVFSKECAVWQQENKFAHIVGHLVAKTPLTPELKDAWSRRGAFPLNADLTSYRIGRKTLGVSREYKLKVIYWNEDARRWQRGDLRTPFGRDDMDDFHHDGVSSPFMQSLTEALKEHGFVYFVAIDTYSMYPSLQDMEVFPEFLKNSRLFKSNLFAQPPAGIPLQDAFFNIPEF